MDYLIIGAGPAGLQLGYFLKEAGLEYLILEGSSGPGAFFEQYPRHRKLISINKPNTGCEDPEVCLRMDWNSLLSDDPKLRFTNYSPRYFPPADELVRYLRDFAQVHDLRIQYNTRVAHILRDREFHVTDAEGRSYSAKHLVVATGVSQPYTPEIPGIETAESYTTMPTDPVQFTNQRVLILGKGNSAFETADNLMETAAVIHIAGPSSIRFAWRSHFVGHLRAVNNNFLDTYQLKSQNALLDGNVLRIERNERGYLVSFSFSRVNEVVKQLQYDRVLVCTGFQFDASIFDESCRPQLTIKDRFPAQTAEWESVNVPGLYFAGTLMQARDYKKSTGGFIHGFRYGVRALARILERKHQGQPWPHQDLQADAAQWTEATITRVNRTSALWQQFAFLCDVVEVGSDRNAKYLEELPVDYVHQSEIGQGECYFTITLEYGPHHDKVDPFDIDIARVAQDNAEDAHEGQYLHPVVRRYRRGELLATHHVAENLENEWTGPRHREPLQEFFTRELARDEAAQQPSEEKEAGVWVG